MTERPILMGAPMVRALLAGTKTQTRRFVKPVPPAGVDMISQLPATDPYLGCVVAGDSGVWGDEHGLDLSWKCPYGVPGDRLWVKETWRAARYFDDTPPRDIPDEAGIRYDGDGGNNGLPMPMPGKIRQSIFMMRWMARLVLEIGDVRVERLHAITEADAIAEGIEYYEGGELPDGRDSGGGWLDYGSDDDAFTLSPIESFRSLWDSINSGEKQWSANPWVWVVEFRRVEV